MELYSESQSDRTVLSFRGPDGEAATVIVMRKGAKVWMSADSPDLVIAKRLLDHLKLRGFRFQRTAPGADAPLVGHRVSDDWADTIQIEGRDCYAWRKRESSLIVPGGGLVEHRVEGSALTVLNEVLTWEMGTLRIASAHG